jgi:hypothetical protein
MAKRQRQRRDERRREHAERKGLRTRHSMITGAGIAAGAALGLASSAAAAPLYLTVDTTTDPNSAGACDDATANDCSLRQAITLTNTNPGYDYIYFQAGLSGSIGLTTVAGGQISITDATYIYGPGPDVLSVNAATGERIFDVDPVTSGDAVRINGLALTGGDVTGNGGAIQNEDAALQVNDAVLSGNTASGSGGAVYDAGSSNGGYDDRFRYSTFSGNSADSGGAIYAAGSWGLIRESTFSGNYATSGTGGAIFGAGTGPYNGPFLIDSTISGNHATGPGGGIDANTIGLYGTITANNTGSANPDIQVNAGQAAYDLVKTPGSIGFSGNPTVILGQDPQLGGLADNGGYTPTLKPAAGSPVVDQSYSPYYSDQRFGDRIIDNPNKANVPGGNGADIGAVELTLAEGPQATPPAPTPTPTPLPPKKKKKKCKKKHKRSAVAAKKKCKKKKKRAASSVHLRIAMPRGAQRLDSAGDQAFRLSP